MIASAIRGLRAIIGDWLWLRTLRRHHSRMGRVDAPRYTRHLERCRAISGGGLSVLPADVERARHFSERGFVSFSSLELLKTARAIGSRVRNLEQQGELHWQSNGRFEGNLATTFPELETVFTGEVAGFAKAYYGANFRIYFGLLYKSERVFDDPRGSQLWHADGGPGTCINLMFL